MAVFQQSDSTSGKKGISPILIVIIVLVVLLCCCCIAAVILYATSHGHPLGIGKKNTFLPLYLTLRTLL